MKTLLILRHAKSSWSDPGLADHDRPLNERGKDDAPRVGHWLRDRRLVPDRVLSSTAKRARQTARKAIQAAGFTTPVELVHELYLASPSTCIDLLQRLPDGVDCALLVGHNPGLEELLLQITGQEEPLCTAALAHVHLFIDQWRELSANTRGTLQTVWRPKS